MVFECDAGNLASTAEVDEWSSHKQLELWTEHNIQGNTITSKLAV